MNNIFLEGKTNVGKTTLILDICKQLNLDTTGFISVKVCDDASESVGFLMQPYENFTNTVININVANKELMFMTGLTFNRSIHLEVFPRLIPYFKEFETKQCFIMDEIGGIELLSVDFYNFILEVLNSPIFCIGTLKSIDNLHKMYHKCNAQLSAQLNEQDVLDFRAKLLKASTVLTLTKDNKEQVKSSIIDIVKRST
ncbi:MAG: hypothetical protein BEN19_07825 [Epulopiscium sp. Nuni2H_MBin003]|nr:MAG: hypothetical protein BEN19_07825 [Epulopiscium sp. Nuni2H_MBin003]